MWIVPVVTVSILRRGQGWSYATHYCRMNRLQPHTALKVCLSQMCRVWHGSPLREECFKGWLPPPPHAGSWLMRITGLDCFGLVRDACSSESDSLSLRFNGHFPGEPGLAGVYWSKGWWRWWVVTTGAISCAKLQSNHHHQQTNIQFFLQAGCPVCRPTNSVKALKGKYHIPWTCWPQAHLGVFQLCLWPQMAPGCLGVGGGGVAMPIISPQMPVPEWIESEIFIYST